MNAIHPLHARGHHLRGRRITNENRNLLTTSKIGGKPVNHNFAYTIMAEFV